MKYRKFCDDEFINESNPGERFEHPVEMVDVNGSEYDIKYSDSVIDLQEYINSFADSVDINLIIDRFTKGDISAIPGVAVVSDDGEDIVDITHLPENPHELHERVVTGNEIFDNLPNDVKALYNSPDDFFNSINSTVARGIADGISEKIEKVDSAATSEN